MPNPMMRFYSKEDNHSIVYLYHVVTDKEFEYVVTHQYKLFPIRFFQKPFFCPTLNMEYAQRIASERANWLLGVRDVHILRFLVRTEAIKQYINGTISNTRSYVVVPKEKLVDFNRAIIGYIERIETVQVSPPANEVALT